MECRKGLWNCLDGKQGENACEYWPYCVETYLLKQMIIEFSKNRELQSMMRMTRNFSRVDKIPKYSKSRKVQPLEKNKENERFRRKFEKTAQLGWAESKSGRGLSGRSQKVGVA